MTILVKIQMKCEKKNVKDHDNDIHNKNDVLFLLFSVIYAYWTSCDDYLKTLRIAFYLIETNARIFMLRLNNIWRMRWEMITLKHRHFEWFEKS
jgi:hypothetical protein